VNLMIYWIINNDDTIIFLSAVSAPDQCEKNYDVAHKINVKNTITLISELLKKCASDFLIK
jgi:dTDP-4-dehydrorhamnose reductase